MSRFGDFTLLDDLGSSTVADRYKATHATLGGPFFLKVYRRLNPGHLAELQARGDRLIGKSHPQLAPHLGHGVVDGVAFVVSPWLDGLDLIELSTSMKDRRVNLTLDQCLLLLGDLTSGVAALHALADNARLAHGDVSLRHVRVGPDGQVRLTGLCTPRGLEPGKIPEARFDLAGVGALVYDLVPLLRGGAARPPLPTSLDRVIRRALGIGPIAEHLGPAEFAERLGEVFQTLKMNPDRAPFVEVVQRTIRAIEKKQGEAQAALRQKNNPADAIPELVPVPKNGPVPPLPPLAPIAAPVAAPMPVAPPLAAPAPPPPAPAATPWSVLQSSPPSFLTGAASRSVPTAPSPTAPSPAAPSPSPTPPRSPSTPTSPSPFASLDASFLTGSASAAPGLARQPTPMPGTVPAVGPSPFGQPSGPPSGQPPSPFGRPGPSPFGQPSPFAQPSPSPFAQPSPSPTPFAQPSPSPSPFGQPSPSPLPSPFAQPSPFGQPSPSPFAQPLSSPFGPTPAVPAPSLPAPPALPLAAPPVLAAPSMPSMPSPPAVAPTMPPVAAPAPPLGTPRPATMPMMPVPSMTELQGLGDITKAPRPTLLADADDSGHRTQRPAFAAAPPMTPPFEQPVPKPPVHNPALNERTDPDATKPLRIEAQKALPAVKALLAAGIVHEGQVEAAAVEQASRGGRTVEILVGQGFCTDAAVADTLAAATGARRLADDALVVRDQALLKRLPQTYALARRLLPLALDAGNLVLAVADPFDTKVIDEVKDLVHALGVDVRVAARAALTQATLKAFADLHGATVTQSGPRILLGIQDDDKAQTLGARLVQEGMQVEHVVDGATARSIVQTRPPDAVICTWDLPGVDGQGVLLAARNNEKTNELPVFIIGPRSDDDLMAKVLDLGADDYFGEPVRPDVVVAKLRRAVGKAQGRPSQPPTPVAPPAAPPPVQSLPPALPRKPPAPPPTTAPLGEDFAFDDLPDLPPEFDNQPAPEVAAMPTGVMGTLRQMSLPEIVQSLEMGRKTAIVDVVPQDGEKGAIGFEGGAVRFAACGELLGDAAFFALMRHKEGFFRIHYGDAPKSLNIDAPTTYLLLEAMRLMDEEGL